MPKPPKPRRLQPRLDPSRGPASPPPEMIELVDPAWLLKALGGTIGIGMVCAYITLCIMFAKTEWQLVLHPSRTVSTDPSSRGLPFTEVHFGPADTPLDGWWIPSGLPSDPTALILHGGDGTMAVALPQAALLHEEGFQVLLFDYRGFGRSGGAHPTQALMQADAESALNFTIATQHASPGGLLVYGIGLGGPIAVQLCQAHAGIAALVLDAPDGDLAKRAAADVRSHIVPVSLLFHEDFPLAAPLATLYTPKLLITHNTGPAPPALQQAHTPRITVELPPGASIRPSLARFVDAIFPRNTLNLTP
jgi:pimeloyl-ACP methyl ester carboxylesterase